MRLGYACINNSLAALDIHTNRAMVKKTFLAKGPGYASELAVKNVADLVKVIQWNIDHNISLFRMSSDIFPWMSEYEIDQLPDYLLIRDTFSKIGQLVADHDLRLTFHPGPFNVLASSNAAVIGNTIKELRQHAQIMDIIGMPLSPFAKINIHIGGAYGDKRAAVERFISNFWLLPANVRARLTVENDDRPNLFSVADLMHVHQETGAPIIFDHHHHAFCTGGLSEEHALRLAISTWPDGIVPVVHFSNSKSIEVPAATPASHADYLYESVRTYGLDVDVMLEAKAKEFALMKYRAEFGQSDLAPIGF